MYCKAELHIADDCGDNHATMRCQLAAGHDGPHEERFERHGEVVLTWVCDEREPDNAPETRREPCGENCHCAESIGDMSEGVTCYRKAPFLVREDK